MPARAGVAVSESGYNTNQSINNEQRFHAAAAGMRRHRAHRARAAWRGLCAAHALQHCDSARGSSAAAHRSGVGIRLPVPRARARNALA